MLKEDPRAAIAAGPTWTAHGRRSFENLFRYMSSLEGVDPDSWAEKVMAALEKIRFFPLRCAVACIRDGRPIRRLVVEEQTLVYYVYFLPRSADQRGRISVRAVHHAAKRNPLAGVRETEVACGAGRHGLWID
jgi:hypothetical protein